MNFRCRELEEEIVVLCGACNIHHRRRNEVFGGFERIFLKVDGDGRG